MRLCGAALGARARLRPCLCPPLHHRICTHLHAPICLCTHLHMHPPIGICTHLGCSPTYRPEVAPDDLGADWKGGWFCPCHGSKFDLAGRVYKGAPAPTNLVIPKYTYLNETTILIGEDEGAA